MDSFEINKIITAVLLVVLLVFGVGKLSDVVFEVKKPDIDGYKVELMLKELQQLKLVLKVKLILLLY